MLLVLYAFLAVMMLCSVTERELSAKNQNVSLMAGCALREAFVVRV